MSSNTDYRSIYAGDSLIAPSLAEYTEYRSTFESKSPLTPALSTQEDLEEPLKQSRSTAPVLTANDFQRWRQRNSLVGWKFGVRSGLILTFVILIMNVGITAGVIRSRGVDSDGKATLFGGNCTKVKRYNTVAHLIINVLSTLLLGASNYTMQCLCAPTRAEIDAGHSRGLWLDIGMPSVKNLKFISKGRVILWILLTASSWPLHLFFNSAVFTTLYAHTYDVYTVKQNFVRSDALSNYSPSNLTALNGVLNVTDIHLKAYNNTLTKLSKSDCIEKFDQAFQTDYNLLLLVLNTSIAESPDSTTVVKNLNVQPPNAQPGVLGCPAEADSIAWICQDMNPDYCNTFCTSLLSQLESNATNWATFGQIIDHCLVNKAPDHCMLNFSVPIMAIVIFVNVIKAAMMCIVGLLLKSVPIITLGDAIASFLTRPDVSPNSRVGEIPQQSENRILVNGKPVIPKRIRMVAVSNRRWYTCFWIYVGSVLLVAILPAYGVNNASDKRHIWSLGFGAADPRTIIYSWSLSATGISGVVENALIANLAQPVLSLVYYIYNSCLTAMASAAEWDGFALNRKGLRVSGVPQGAQRSTHLLQLPYRFSIPLMIFSILLHWLISQSIFVVSVITDDGRNLAGKYTSNPYFVSCGYSPTPMLVVIGLGILMIVFAVVVGRVRLKSDIPIAGNSKLIARECHPEDIQEDEPLRRLQWELRKTGEPPTEWCAFSSLPVEGFQESKTKSPSLGTRLRFPFRKHSAVKKEDEIPLHGVSQ